MNKELLRSNLSMLRSKENVIFYLEEMMDAGECGMQTAVSLALDWSNDNLKPQPYSNAVKAEIARLDRKYDDVVDFLGDDFRNYINLKVLNR